MLLEDQKSHEEVCIKQYKEYANQAKDPQLKQLFNNYASKEQEHLNTINQILNGQYLKCLRLRANKGDKAVKV